MRNRLLAAFFSISGMTAIAQTPAGPAARPASQSAVAATPAKIGLVGFGELVELDADHLLLRVTVNGSADTRDIKLDLDGYTLRLTIDNTPAAIAEVKLPAKAWVQWVSDNDVPVARVDVGTPMVRGVLQAVNGLTLTMKTKDNPAATVTTDDKTKVVLYGPIDGQPDVRIGRVATVADLTAGLQLVVRPPQGVAQSVEATVPIPPPVELEYSDLRDGGYLRSVNGRSVVLASVPRRIDVPLEIDDRTKISLDGLPATVDQIKPNMHLSFRRIPDAKPPRPTLVMTLRSEETAGYIVEIDGDTLTLNCPHMFTPDDTVTVTLNDTLKIEIDRRDGSDRTPGTRADLKLNHSAYVIRHNGRPAVLAVSAVPATQPATLPAP